MSNSPTIKRPRAFPNQPRFAGRLASAKTLFGPASRFAVFAVHSRFDGPVEWFVADAERIDPLTNLPQIIRQSSSFEGAIDGLLEGLDS